MLLDTVKQLMPGFHNGNTHKLNGDSRLLHGPLTDASIEKAIETQVVKFDPPI